MNKSKIEEEEAQEPVSPTGQYLNSSVLCIYIIGVLESQIPINDSQTLSLLNRVFLPINPRFSSIMIREENGERKWKQVEVKLEEHINIPIFPTNKNSSPLLYDEYLDEYMSKIAREHLPQSRPLWEIHIIKYPTSNAAGTLIFKLHHALGDGYSLMGALLSCLQSADNPSLPLMFPSRKRAEPLFSNSNSKSIFKRLPGVFSLAFNTISEFGWSLLKSSLVEDEQTPIRSGDEDKKLRHVAISNVCFSLDHIKEVKSKLGVGINDVTVGLIFYGIRLYMQEINQKSGKAQSTALVLLNTRNITGYKSVQEMVKTNGSAPWGNRFAFLHVPIPQLSDPKYSNPLEFVWEAHKVIKKKKDSLAVPLTGMLLDSVNKLRGSEAAAKYVHSTLRNSSATISSIMGPEEQVALDNHPIKGLYFMVVGPPQLGGANWSVLIIAARKICIGLEGGKYYMSFLCGYYAQVVQLFLPEIECFAPGLILPPTYPRFLDFFPDHAKRFYKLIFTTIYHTCT